MPYKKLLICLALICCSNLFAAKRNKADIPKVNHESEVVATEKPFALTPPKGWQYIKDKAQLPGKVELLFVGAGTTGQFTPSINLATEETLLPVEEYISLAKKYHESQGDTRCTPLGSLDTQAGPVQLLQIDRKTSWGDVRFIQASLINAGQAYVITATCLQKDFNSYCSPFFQTIQSFTIFGENARYGSE
ncbi:MAG: hypothetical protein KR126chlam2_01058 [Chlamydiae bacterium]|nr:hypothetical protein [Chlamydiota bacterium]